MGRVTLLFLALLFCSFVTFESSDPQNVAKAEPSLDPKITKILKEYKPTDYSTILPKILRAGFEERFKKLKRFDEPLESIVDKKITHDHFLIPLRIYTPKNGKGLLPVVLFFHGGGWVVGSLETADDVCRTIANRSSAIVVSVDYRLAPEHKFPAAIEDGFAVLNWVHKNGKEIGANPDQIILAGDSAGGNIAASLALYARDHKGPPIALQVLIYPATNYSFDTLSYFQNEDGYKLRREDMLCFWNHYITKAADGLNPYASPLKAADLHNLPPALILTAHYDVLRDDGEGYGARLEHAGVKTKVIRYLDMIHGFISYGPEYPSANHALNMIASEITATCKH